MKLCVHRSDSTRLAMVAMMALCFSARTAAMKFLSVSIPPEQMLFFQNFVAFFLIWPFIGKGFQKKSSPKAITMQFLRAFAESGMLFLAYMLLRHLPTVNVTLFSNWAPLFLPLLALIWLPKKPSLRLIAGLVIGWIGILVWLMPWMNMPPSIKGLALATGLLGGIVLLVSMRLSKTEHPTKTLFFSHLIPTIFFFLVMFIRWRPPTPTEWLILFILGILTIVMEILAVLVCRMGPAYPIHPFFYLAVVFSGFIDYYVWSFIPKAAFVVSAVIIVTGCCFVVYDLCPHKKQG